MDKRILLPTDFSKNALNAIRYALELYKNVRCEFYFLNVFKTNDHYLDKRLVPEPGERFYEAAKLNSNTSMNKLMEVLRFQPENNKHIFHAICTFNSLLVAVEDVLRAKDIDVIVMGTKGITDDSKAILGTNTVGVMEKITQCPTIAVPASFSFSPPEEIVFPTDYKTPFRRIELGPMLEIAKMHSSSIHVLHIEKEAILSTDQVKNKALLTEMLEDVTHSFHELTKVGVGQGVKSFVESRDSDMITFLNRKHRFFNSWLSNPLLKEIGYNSEIPIMVLKDNS
ncbi:universal stress protein [Aurantibacter crassamenti]|uniref:universal stress protein n=1 Tax=Aurantibacter crassamenti TaxID=1837375 RepID=UPI001939BCC7|nr:universal stress protein [Aurantibacter crassamenti]MBM1106586.1 universal stress protein [Aurantibacter crassamenti]